MRRFFFRTVQSPNLSLNSNLSRSAVYLLRLFLFDDFVFYILCITQKGGFRDAHECRERYEGTLRTKGGSTATPPFIFSLRSRSQHKQNVVLLQLNLFYHGLGDDDFKISGVTVTETFTNNIGSCTL